MVVLASLKLAGFPVVNVCSGQVAVRLAVLVRIGPAAGDCVRAG